MTNKIAYENNKTLKIKPEKEEGAMKRSKLYDLTYLIKGLYIQY